MPEAEDKDKEAFSRLIDELKKNCRRHWFRPKKIWVYAEPKCQYCDRHRMIHAIAPNGQELVDYCRCGEKKKQVWITKPYEIEVFVIPEANSAAAIEVIPSKMDTNGAIVMSWYADPSPEGQEAPDLMLYNSLFSTMEGFREFCRANDIEYAENSVEEEA